MTITPRVLHGACRVPSTPMLRIPGHRPSAVHGRAMASCLPMAAAFQTATDPIPAIVIA